MKYRNIVAAVSALAICAVPFSALGSMTASADEQGTTYYTSTEANEIQETDAVETYVETQPAEQQEETTEPHIVVEVDPTEETAEGETQPATEETTEPQKPSAVDMMMEHYDEWKEDATVPTGGTLVGFLDIDFDNELELVTSNTDGSGVFTYMNFYKLDDDKLVKLDVVDKVDFPEGEYQLYRDKDGKTEYYGNDFLKNGVYYHENTFSSFTYQPDKNGVARTNHLGALFEATENPETHEMEEKYWWQDYSTDTKIETEEEYNKLADEKLTELTDLHLNYEFVDIRKMTTPEEIHDALQKSYDTFHYDGFNGEEVGEKDYQEVVSDGIKYHVYEDHAVVVGMDNSGILRHKDGLKQVTIPESVQEKPVTEIAGDAFKDTYVPNLHIGKNVEVIDPNAFDNVTGLSFISVDEENEHFVSDAGVLFNKDKSTLLLYPSGSDQRYYTIPYGVKEIADHAFQNCRISDLTTNSDLEKVGNYAFADSEFLQYIRFPENVVSIGEHCLENCPRLGDVIFESYCTIPIDPTTISNGLRVPEDAQPTEDGKEPEPVPYFDGTIFAFKGSDGEKYANTYGYKYVEAKNQKMILDEQLGRTSNNNNTTKSYSTNGYTTSYNTGTTTTTKTGAPLTSDKLPSGLAAVGTALTALVVFIRRKHI